jgi:hypothetical protein
MITFENMASFICYYGGFPYDQLAQLREEKLALYEQTGYDKDKKRADQFALLMKMLNEHVTFEERLTTSTFYYQPKEGWDILNDYLVEGGRSIV